MASVAILRLTSVIRFSRSRLQVVTEVGCIMATLFKVRTAANLKVGLGELKNSCRTERKQKKAKQRKCKTMTGKEGGGSANAYLYYASNSVGSPATKWRPLLDLTTQTCPLRLNSLLFPHFTQASNLGENLSNLLTLLPKFENNRVLQ